MRYGRFERPYATTVRRVPQFKSEFYPPRFTGPRGAGGAPSRVCVCLSMFVHAAASSAVRPAAILAPRPPLELNMLQLGGAPAVEP